MPTGRDLCTQALLEINVNDPLDAPNDADLTFVLGKTNRILDNWNADQQAVYGDQFLQFTIPINTAPITIGLAADSPDLVVAGVRPESIDGVALIYTTSTPQARTVLTKRDAQWWQNNTVPTITATVPSDWYYDNSYPLGNLYLWPVPTQANGIQLWLRTVLSQLTLNTVFAMPPGYYDALILTTAEDICGAFQKPMPPMLPDKARRARARVFSANQTVPRLPMRDAGMPRAGNAPGYPNFNWLTGSLT